MLVYCPERACAKTHSMGGSARLWNAFSLQIKTNKGVQAGRPDGTIQEMVTGWGVRERGRWGCLGLLYGHLGAYIHPGVVVSWDGEEVMTGGGGGARWKKRKKEVASASTPRIRAGRSLNSHRHDKHCIITLCILVTMRH